MGWAWRGYVVAMIAATAAGFVVPAGGAATLGLNLFTGLLPVAAILAGLRRVPPGERAPWRFFAAGLLSLGAGVPGVGRGRRSAAR
ncbi:hypothetical protein [Actinoplanes sp. M2I2]|uniref:hypothetical protein n=1 Tax=Actinoplanes sp. M2I2 TaxID=1734444 RepID=UPI0020223A87|nr:hypothetical protein [Actinoplanes sp. M2I2]